MSNWWFEEDDTHFRRQSTVFDFPIRKSDKVPYGYIDEGIRKTVRVLNNGGVNTLSCCEGHGDAPWITCDTLKQPLEIAEILHRAGASGFEIQDCWAFGKPDYCVRGITIRWSYFHDGVCK